MAVLVTKMLSFPPRTSGSTDHHAGARGCASDVGAPRPAHRGACQHQTGVGGAENPDEHVERMEHNLVVESEMVGDMVGDVVGVTVGSEVVGERDGASVGSEVVGDTEGDNVGSELVGDSDGDNVECEIRRLCGEKDQGNAMTATRPVRWAVPGRGRVRHSRYSARGLGGQARGWARGEGESSSESSSSAPASPGRRESARAGSAAGRAPRVPRGPIPSRHI